MGRTITLDEISGRSAADFLRDVARAQGTLCVVLENSDVVTLDPRTSAPEAGEAVPPVRLKPLPRFNIVIPEGWKDAIYDHSDSET